MSTIERMTIQGIRSYGPRDQDTQMIEFFNPVTLIVGQNGCGKTTIIECLKYSTTGDLPPNTKGASFLFDPKLIDEVETKGRIKLFFRDTSDLTVQVQKNLCVTQKAKKTEFRTLETIISRYNKESKLISTITSKCINADAEVMNAFGVSKAVLEYVIFCHQEDANWPLSEGKVLKTRFDEIFSATKYIKALDILKKVRLEKSHIIKQKEIEKKYLEANKIQFDKLNRDLDENKMKYANLKAKSEATKEKLVPINKQLDFYFKESARIFDIKSQLDKIENEKVLLEKQIKELLQNTKDCLFQGSDAELQEYVQKYESTNSKMRKEQVGSLTEEIDELNGKLKELGRLKGKLSAEMGAAETKHKSNIENKQKLMKYGQKASVMMGLESIEGEELLKTLKVYIEDYEAETQISENQGIEKMSRVEKLIEQEKESKAKLDQTLSSKKELVMKNTDKLTQIDSEIKLTANSKVIESVNLDIEKLEVEMKMKQEALGDPVKAQNEQNELENHRTALRKKEVKLDEQLNKLHQNSKIQTEIELLKADKQSKDDQLRKIKIRIKDECDSFFENFGEERGSDLNLKSF